MNRIKSVSLDDTKQSEDHIQLGPRPTVLTTGATPKSAVTKKQTIKKKPDEYLSPTDEEEYREYVSIESLTTEKQFMQIELLWNRIYQ